MQVLYDGKIPIKVFLFRNGLIMFLLFGWNIGLISSILRSRSNYLKIDEEAITYTKGLISKDEERVELYRVRDSGYKQGILDRIVGIGKLTITSDDDSSPMIEISMTNPKSILDRLRPLIRSDRQNMKSTNFD